MATLEYYDIILKPIQTEKALQDIAEKRYAFYVHPEANKFQIKTAVERMFEGTKVARVNTMNCLRWITTYSRARSERTMKERLANEIMEAMLRLFALYRSNRTCGRFSAYCP